jgi:hypothetical protein
MSVVPDRPISDAVRWAQQLQRANSTAPNQVVGDYLRGCANLAMAHTPHQALMELHKMQTGLLRHSVDTIAEVITFWRKQNTELLRLCVGDERSANTFVLSRKSCRA